LPRSFIFPGVASVGERTGFFPDFILQAKTEGETMALEEMKQSKQLYHQIQQFPQTRKKQSCSIYCSKDRVVSQQ